MQPRKAIPKNASHILELADGSEDDEAEDDMPGLEVHDDTDDEDSDDEDIEVAAESAEAELSTCPMPVKDIKLTINNRTTFKRLELTSLRILQAHRFDRVYQGASCSRL
jgi:hypothetical protein